MMHKPIQFESIGLSFPHKPCFDDFSVHIPFGSRIAIIGRNGCGKTTLLKILQRQIEPSSGTIKIPGDVVIGYVPQVLDSFDSLSGGERLNKAFTEALSLNPNVLLLDEPTNHLDKKNRKSIMRMLCSFTGTLLLVSHDVELLNHCVDTLWHIDQDKIHIFSGNYSDYIKERKNKRASIEEKLSRLNRQKKDMHQVLMKEQTRAAKSRAKGAKNIEQRKWPTIVSNAKALRAEETSGRKKAEISQKKQTLNEKLAELRLNEVIIPKFSLSPAEMGNRTLVSVSEGNVHYAGDGDGSNRVVLCNISLSITARDRVAILGDNGSGKSTLVRAILQEPKIIKTGHWHMPKLQDISYLDQHYATLSLNKSVLETIQTLMPNQPQVAIRRHLTDFLFRQNEEVNALVSTLSGGEKARLCLAQIAAKTPKLLILDEITNNLDLETREHVIQVLKEYPGAMMVISHDEDFLKAIGVNQAYLIDTGKIAFLSI